MIALICILLVSVLTAQEKPGVSDAALHLNSGALDAGSGPSGRPGSGLPDGATGRRATDHAQPVDTFSQLFVFMLATFIGLGVVARVSRLLHTPLMSLTNAISGIAVVGSIIVAGGDYPLGIRLLGVVALFASMTNVVSGFLITDRMLKMFKQPGREGKP
jgi:NAD(P) transhydrogenase subunit alpha